MQDGRESVSGVQESTVDASTESTTEASESVSESAETEVSQTEEEEPNESARETVARILKESEDSTEGEKENGSEKPTSSRALQAKSVKKVQKGENFVIPPPNRLTVEQKEIFHQLPDNLKRATHKMFQDQEAQYTKAVQLASKQAKEAGHVIEAVRPYLLAHPELGEQGFTESRLVGALVAAHQRLTDPKTAKATWLELGENVGVDRDTLDKLSKAINGGQNGQIDISNHPQFISLQEKLNKLTSTVDGAEKQKFDASVQRIVSEMEAVREERDSFGKYVYPKLHDEAFLARAKPLVSALVAALPGLDYGEALRRAYRTLEGQAGNSTQVNQARLPEREQLERAQRAAVSVRGRSAPSGTPGTVTEIPQEALGNARDSVRWALDQLRRGG